MMKRILFILVTTSLMFACAGTKKHYTDANEWGYKGKVKRIVTKIYFDLVKYNHWIVNEDKLASINIKEFDKQGRMITVIDSSVSKKYTAYYQKYVYKHDGNLTTSFVVYNKEGKQIGESEFTWLSKRKYRQQGKLAEAYGEYTIDAYATLNKNYRDWKGHYTMNRENYVLKRYYQNHFGKYDNLVATTKIDTIFNYGKRKIVKHETVLEDVKTDAHHNFLQYATVDAKTGKLKKYVVREITYYDE